MGKILEITDWKEIFVRFKILQDSIKYLALFCLFKYINLSEKLTSLNIEKSYQNIFLPIKPFYVTRKDLFVEVASSQTEVVAGSVGGVLVLAIIVLILGIIVQRRYSCICNIGNYLATHGFH